MIRRAEFRFALALLAAATLIGACSASDTEESASVADAPAAQESGGGSEGSGGLTIDRIQIVSATMRVVVDDPVVAATTASELAENDGGYVELESTDAVGDGGSSLTLRVPTDRLGAVMDAIAAYGDLEAREVLREDVTAQVADVDSRVTSAEASIARLNELLARAESTEAIVAVESELARREADLEALQAQQRVLSDDVALARLSVSFTAEAGATDWPGPLDALRRGFEFVIAAVRAVVLVAAFLLPVLVLLAPGIWWLRRRLRRAADRRAEAARQPRGPLPPPQVQ